RIGATLPDTYLLRMPEGESDCRPATAGRNMTMIELSRRLFLRHIGSAMAAAFALIAHVSPVAAQGVPQDWTTMPTAPDVTFTVPFEPAEPDTSPQRKNGSTSIPRSPLKVK